MLCWFWQVDLNRRIISFLRLILTIKLWDLSNATLGVAHYDKANIISSIISSIIIIIIKDPGPACRDMKPSHSADANKDFTSSFRSGARPSRLSHQDCGDRSTRKAMKSKKVLETTRLKHLVTILVTPTNLVTFSISFYQHVPWSSHMSKYETEQQGGAP